MLTPADARLADRDAALPGLDSLLDTAQVLELLKPELSVEWSELDLHANYIRYKKSTSCLVGFSGTYRRSPVHLYARLHPPSEMAKAAKPLRKPLAASPLGPGGLLLQESCLLFMFFPNDHELRVVRKLSYPAFRDKCLNTLLSGSLDVKDCDLTLLRYKPERRWVGRIRMGDKHQFLLKAHDRKYSPDNTCIKDSLLNANVHVRPRLGVIASHRLALYPWIAGTALGPDADPEQLVWVGRQLAKLHTLTCVSPADFTIQAGDAPEAQLREAVNAIADIAPEQGPKAEELSETILRLWYGQPETVTSIRCRIHGDFSSDQVILTGDQPCFIDFDRTAVSHPIYDLGSFLARLHHDQINGFRSSASLAAHSQALVEGYCEASSWPLADLVGPALALQLLKLAPEAFRLREPDWPVRLNQVLQRTAHILTVKGDAHAA